MPIDLQPRPTLILRRRRPTRLSFRKEHQRISALTSVNTNRGIIRAASKSLRSTRRHMQELQCVQCVVPGVVSYE